MPRPSSARCRRPKRDPRITRIGHLMRATAMDELPQLWNIFRGDMSFVGPRALRPGEIEATATARSSRSRTFRATRERCRMRPGLTGVAQIYAPRDVGRAQQVPLRPRLRQARELLARRPTDPAVVLDHVPRTVGSARRQGLATFGNGQMTRFISCPRSILVFLSLAAAVWLWNPIVFISEDCYFYAVVARNLALTGVQSFWGVEPPTESTRSGCTLLAGYDWIVARFSPDLLYHPAFGVPLVVALIAIGSANLLVVAERHASRSRC